MYYKGIAELPLHDGYVPEYLIKRMRSLGSLIAKYIVEIYGPRELLSRFSNPLWFQAFNNVIGMDWDSSGSTTVVLYVLKTTFPPTYFNENEIAVLGGKGSDAKAIPNEAFKLSKIINSNKIIELSRLTAKIDSVGLQDGYSLYIHSLIVSREGDLLVIQQGMNIVERLARRYHIFIDKHDIVNCEKDPHSGVASLRTAPALNLIDENSEKSRRAVLEILWSTPVNSIIQDIHRVNRLLKALPDITSFSNQMRIKEELINISNKTKKCPLFYRPITDVKQIANIAECIKKEAPSNFRDLLLLRGLGPESLRAIALVADLIYGYEPSFRDPTTHFLDPFLYAYAHGGKDGVPYRISTREVDKTIEFFSSLINEIKLSMSERELLLKNLAEFVSRIKKSNVEIK